MTLPFVEIPRPRAYPPRVTEVTNRFWQALREGRFETTHCVACGRLSFPPKPFCPHCWGRDLSWVELSGKGRLYSKTVVHAVPAVFSDESPIPVCIIDLDEGVRIATRLVDGADLALDEPVQLLVLRFTDGVLFAARPIVLCT